jgi:hypothetical protein
VEEDLIDMAIRLCLGILACGGLLYFGKLLWWVYVQTAVGEEYARLFAANASDITRFYDQDLMQLSLQVNWLVTKAALLVGVVGQALFLTSQFYESQDAPQRFLFCTLPFAAIVATYVHKTLALGGGSWLVLVLVPSAFLFDSCIRVTSRILPEGMLLRVLWRCIVECKCLFMKCDLQ